MLQGKRIKIWRLLPIAFLCLFVTVRLKPIPWLDGVPIERLIIPGMVLLTVLILALVWRLNQTANRLVKANRDIEKNLQTLNAISRLLTLQSSFLDENDLFSQALSILFSMEWLTAECQGAILLNNAADNRFFKLAAHIGLSESALESCLQIINDCHLFGPDELDMNVKHSSQAGRRRSQLHDAALEYGYYIVPLISETKPQGVLFLFYPANHPYNPGDVDALKALGAALADLIRHNLALMWLGLAETVFMHSLTCLLVTDAKCRTIRVNPAYTKVTGYAIEDIKGKQPGFLGSERHDAGFYAEMLQKIAETGLWQGEIWDRRKNGEYFLEWLSIAAVNDHNGNPQNYIAAFADITRQKATENRILELAYFDNLTGLANRSLFYDRFEQSLIHAKRNGGRLALLFIDLDRFKEVNDVMGHAVGDSFLKIVASRIGQCLRESDVLARLGGDEFVVLLKDLDETPHGAINNCKKVAGNILRVLSESYRFDRYTFHGGCSIGVAIYPDHGASVGDLMQKADTAMYEAKEAGRNTYRFFSKEQSLALENKLNMRQALRQALKNNEFDLAYQPLVNMQDGAVIGAEVLLRWRHPEFGAISPEVFIPLAEENSLIVTIGEWAFGQACRQLQAWKGKALFQIGRLAVNVTIHELLHPGYADRILAICRQFNIPPAKIELEIGESCLAHKSDALITTLAQLKKSGFTLAIDDFGADYSSLSRLKLFNVDLLKIDSDFVGNMTADPDNAALARAIIELVRALGVTPLAKGVETEAQYELLKTYNCERGQGYFFGEPMSAVEFEAFCGLSA